MKLLFLQLDNCLLKISESGRLLCGCWELKVAEPGTMALATLAIESISLRITSAWETTVDFMWMLALICCSTLLVL